MSIENRKLLRRHLIYYLRVFDNLTGDLLGHLVDLTVEGLMLVSEEPIKTKKHYELRMVLPKEIHNQTTVTFEAESLWNKKDINPSFYVTGFRIKSLSPDVTSILDYVISMFGFPEDQQIST